MKYQQWRSSELQITSLFTKPLHIMIYSVTLAFNFLQDFYHMTHKKISSSQTMSTNHYHISDSLALLVTYFTIYIFDRPGLLQNMLY